VDIEPGDSESRCHFEIGDDGFILGLLIGSREALSERLLNYGSFRSREDDPYPETFIVRCSVHIMDPSIQKVTLCQRSRSELSNEVGQNLPFDCCTWFILDAIRFQLRSPLCYPPCDLRILYNVFRGCSLSTMI